MPPAEQNAQEKLAGMGLPKLDENDRNDPKRQSLCFCLNFNEINGESSTYCIMLLLVIDNRKQMNKWS